MAVSTEKTATHAEALTDIIDWSKSRPLWQQDALRRLCNQDEITEQDITEIYAIALGQTEGVQAATLDDICPPETKNQIVKLRSISSVENVNALAEGQELSFTQTGITVIYGDNGSGKSGYARILKKACRARTSKGFDIKPNIYSRQSTPSSALIRYSSNGTNHEFTWESGVQPVPELCAVSVFDSDAASIHVDQANDVAYTPFPLEILKSWADICDAVKKKAKDNIDKLTLQTPQSLTHPKIQAGTKVHTLISGLSTKTNPDQITPLATLSDEENRRLTAIKADLAKDPSHIARQLQALNTELNEHLQKIKRLEALLVPEQVTTLYDQYRDFQAKEQAASLAANTLFTEEPLPHVGGDTWRALWLAARTYSNQLAYPSQIFPNTSQGARCVLCQQELSGEALSRLNRFEAFVQDQTRRVAEEAKSTYTALLNSYKQAVIPISTVNRIHKVLALDLEEADQAKRVKRLLIDIKACYRQVIRLHTDITSTPLVTKRYNSFSAFKPTLDKLTERIKALSAESGSPERKALEAELNELEARKWLSIEHDDILAEIGRLKQKVELEKIMKEAQTKPITDKSSEWAERLVTNSLRAEFAKEVDRLGVAGLAIEIRKERSQVGSPMFKVALIQKPTEKVGSVLSEGEHRCVALAAFLAELTTEQSKSAIVFDDPVCSLDHLHREQVARRLAKEGGHRQIIVFTHDVAFLMLLQVACKDEQAPIDFRCVSRGPEQAGFCNAEPPANARPLIKVIEAIQKQLENQSIHYQQGRQAEWYTTVRSLQEQLRAAWERAVEESVAPVTKRLAHKVHTDGLVKMTVITVDDCRIMRDGFERCSQLLHSEAQELNSPLPKPDVIQAEIDALRQWVEDLRKRQEQAKLT